MDSSTVLIIAIPALLILAAVAILAEGRRRSTTGRLSRETRKSDRSLPAAEAPAPEPAGARAPVEYVPVEEEELGITRRQFFNRGILTGLGIFAAGMGAAMLGFLWPGSAGGFGAKIVVGSESDAKQQFDKKLPFYNAAARTYIQPYPPGE